MAAHTRLEALSGLSSLTLGPGSVWLSAGALPTHPPARRTALLSQLHRLYARELPRARLQPDSCTLNAVLAGLCAAGLVAPAQRFLAVQYPLHGVTPNVHTYRALLSLYAMHAGGRGRSATAALDAYEAMKEQPGIGGADAQCVGLVVHALARERRLEEALRVLQGAKEAGMGRLSETHARLLRARCKEAGVRSDLVPAHPAGWQFTPENMAKRASKSRMVSRQWKHTLRPKF